MTAVALAAGVDGFVGRWGLLFVTSPRRSNLQRMQLATLTTLRCTRRDLKDDGDLQLVATKVEVGRSLRRPRRERPAQINESDYDKAFLLHVLPNLNVRVFFFGSQLSRSGPPCAILRPPLVLPPCQRHSTTCVHLSRIRFEYGNARRRGRSVWRQVVVRSQIATRRSRSDDDLLNALHHVLFDVHVVEGRLVCKESGQIFPIEEGIANMMCALGKTRSAR